MYLGCSYINALKGDAFMWHVIFKYYCLYRPRGLMDKASDFESEDCEFESRRGRVFFAYDQTLIYLKHSN